MSESEKKPESSATDVPGVFIEQAQAVPVSRRASIRLSGLGDMADVFREMIMVTLDDGRPRAPTSPETKIFQLNAQVEDLKGTVQQYEQAYRAINAQPCSYVTVIAASTEPQKWLVKRGAEMLEVSEAAKDLKIKPGDTVRVLTQSGNILSVVDAPPAGGELVRVVDVLGPDTCEVAYGAGTRAVLTGGRAVKAGDRVVLDATNTVVLRNAGPAKPAQIVSTETGVTWDDIGGQAEAKAAMRDAIEGPVLRRDLYARFGRRPTKGVLLFGPPGNGKTMLGKAAASALAALHGGSAGASGFLYVKGPELLSMYVGAAEQGVRKLFEDARRHKAEHGYPAVVFLDEADALLAKRGGLGIGGAVSSMLVPAFLAEMDGMTESGAFVLLATNRPDTLDPAVVREGRIDRKVLVGRPDQLDAIEVFRRHLRGRPLAIEGVELDAGAVAEKAVEMLFDMKHVLYRIHVKDAPPKHVTLGHVTSGAQIAGIVDAAASVAIDRAVAGGDDSGITCEDFEAAIVRTLKEQRCIDHTDELMLFCESFAKSVTDIERADGNRAVAKRPSLIQNIGPTGTQVVAISAGGTA